MEYFRYFPVEEYSNKQSVNILARAKIRDIVHTHKIIFYPYVITDDDRPDIIAQKYYGSSNHTWLIFYANDIIDPLYDWPLNHWEMVEFLEDKYGSISAAHQQIHCYKNADGFIIDQLTYDALAADERSILTAYDYEIERNEELRNINLIDQKFLGQLTYELRQMFK